MRTFKRIYLKTIRDSKRAANLLGIAGIRLFSMLNKPRFEYRNRSGGQRTSLHVAAERPNPQCR